MEHFIKGFTKAKLSTVLFFTLHMCSHLIVKTNGLVGHDLLCINSCWHFPVTFLSLRWLEIDSRWTCFVKFPESDLWLTSLCSSSCSFSCPSWRWVQYLPFYRLQEPPPVEGEDRGRLDKEQIWSLDRKQPHITISQILWHAQMHSVWPHRCLYADWFNPAGLGRAGYPGTCSVGF